MLHDTIRTQLINLGFKGMLNAYDETNEWSPNSQWLDSLTHLLAAEITYRETRSFMYRLKLANLPQMKTLETFETESLSIDQLVLTRLTDGEFIEKNENILIIGGPGTGKTHLALALGYAALQHKYRIKFYRFNQLARALLEAQEHRCERRLIRRLQGFHLLIIDELGYLPVDQKAGALLFELFSALYEKTPVILTTHLLFEEWGNLFGHKKSTQTIIDRFTHHCHILETGHESWRLKEGIMSKN